jgi:hypothetical protein
MEEGPPDGPAFCKATLAAPISFRPEATRLPFLEVRLSRSDVSSSLGGELEIIRSAVFRLGTLSCAEIVAPNPCDK